MEPKIDIRLVSSEQEIEACRAVVTELRPLVKGPDFIRRIQAMQAEGYHLVSLALDKKVIAFAGFRTWDHLAWGKIMYIDDFAVTESLHNKGYGKRLLDWLTDYAAKQQVEQIHLDSGHKRHEAHKFYLNHGFILKGHHFCQIL